MNASMESERVDKEAEDAVVGVLKEKMGPFGFLGAEVRAGRDHDDDPVIFIEARGFRDEPIDSRATLGLVSALRDALEAVGESRFPHVRHHFDDRQRVARSS